MEEVTSLDLTLSTQSHTRAERKRVASTQSHTRAERENGWGLRQLKRYIPAAFMPLGSLIHAK